MKHWMNAMIMQYVPIQSLGIHVLVLTLIMMFMAMVLIVDVCNYNNTIHRFHVIFANIIDPIDCTVSDWTYEECDKVCGGGIQRRTRTVTQIEMYGGSCNYTLEQYVDCNTDECCVDGDIKTFNWDTLTEQGIDVPQYNITKFDINEDDLSIEIEVELDYLGSVTITDGRVGEFGVAYVLDFEDFDAHKDNITQPGTCQNRNHDDFMNGPTWEDYWRFSDEPQNDGNVGDNGYLAYPPPDSLYGDWDVYMKDDGCDTVVYSGKFTWTDLRNCKQYNSIGDPYTDIVSDDNWVNLTGTFYLNVVSPYWPTMDFGYYRVYQLISQPFVIAVSSVVNVLGSTGINLMTLSVIAVYKEDAETDFKLVLLTETTDYLKLTRTSNDVFDFDPDDPNNGIRNTYFIDNTNPENAGSNECLNNKAFICSQLWEINATDIGCTPQKGTDFSGKYKLSFVPDCRDNADNALNAYCAQWLTDHPDIATRVTLDTDLVWRDDICNPIVFTVQFVAAMTFYEDDSFSNPVPDDYLYQVGEDTIYVQINTTFPDGALEVFSVNLIDVHICTFDPLSPPSQDLSDLSTFGCFGDRDDYDKHFFKIYDSASKPPIQEHDFMVILEGASHLRNHGWNPTNHPNIVRFSFTVPKKIARDKLYVQAELEAELQEHWSSSPTTAPTYSPSTAPIDAPTGIPSNAPSLSPTIAPTDNPTAAPTENPTPAPTNQPHLYQI